MYAHHADSILLPPSRNATVTTLVNWLKARLEARRKASADREAISYLRHLDQHVLDDMGIDASTLPDVIPGIVAFHPASVAATVLMGDRRPR
jgi:hypothetical protein